RAQMRYSRAPRNQGPEVTLGFWVVKILATTLGETGGDTVTMTWLKADVMVNAEYLIGSAIFPSGLIVLGITLGVAAQKGQVLAELELPFAGLMRLRPFETVRGKLVVLRDIVRGMGRRLPEPFLQLAFLPLSVIPHLRSPTADWSTSTDSIDCRLTGSARLR